MKLHFNADATSLATTRKLRAVIAATGSQVEEVAHNSGDNVSNLSAINALPLLETAEGTFFASNTIARFLATTNKPELYFTTNAYNQALVDQWLDITTCDFEPSARAISKQVNGEKVDYGKLITDLNKFLDFVEKHLNGKKFLVGETLTIADISLASSISVVFEFLFG
jgi:glutathione S-transferase